MIIVLDGYNILKQTGQREISEHDRLQFVNYLTKYAHAKRNNLIVVFDGGPSRWVHRQKKEGVELIYAGIGQSADDYIKEYVHKHPSRNIIVVSADRELCRYVTTAGAITMEPRAFLQVISSVDLERPSDGGRHAEIVKTSAVENEEIDDLMQDAAHDYRSKNEPTLVSSRTRKSKTLSKEERKLLQKVKKL